MKALTWITLGVVGGSIGFLPDTTAVNLGAGLAVVAVSVTYILRGGLQ